MDRGTFDRVTVAARSAFSHAVLVPDGAALPLEILYSFSTEAKNIRFGVFRRGPLGAQNGVPNSFNGNAPAANAMSAAAANGAKDARRSNTPPSAALGKLLGSNARAFSFPSAAVQPPAPPQQPPSHLRSTSVSVLEARRPPSANSEASLADTQVGSPAAAPAVPGHSRHGSLAPSLATSPVSPLPSPSTSPTRTGSATDLPSLAMPGVLHAKSASAALLQEPGLVQLVPIAHHESSKLAVKGSWVATEPGEYVLYWDNTFSVSTPKKLTYFVSVVPYVPPADPQPGAPAVVIEGWLSKKRSKKMQGWARRWFRLLSDGTLEYAEKRGGEIRGAARVPAAVVTEDAKRLRIDVDSGSALFHMRCANDADFAAWSSALRSFELPEDAEPDGEPEHEDGERPLPAPPTLEALTITPADARPSPLGPRGSFTGEESPYDILKREIARVAEAAHLASLLPPDPDGAASDLAPLLRSIQSRLQRAAEGLLLGNPSPGAMFHPSLGRRLVAGRAASILSAATGVSDEGEFFDAYEGESEPGEGEEEEGEEGMEGEGVPSSAGSAVGIEPPAFESAAELPPPTPAPAEPGAPFFPPARPRRAVLPAPGSCESPVSILSILRGSMGKDLSTISMPIQLNEPLSALQRLAEEFEYSDLLVRACASGDAAERTVLVAAFAVSGYAGTVHRAGRKPFNPLLGETYELARPEAGWRFLAEKVSHHPPVLAYEGEGWCAGGRGWKVWGDSQVKSKFWGKTMEFLPVGSPVRVLLRLGNGREERYTYNRVTTCMRNLIGGGSRYLEHVGELLVRNENTGHACVLQFRESGYFSAAKNEVAGSVRDGDGRDVGKVTGRWDSVISRSVGPGGQGGREVLEVVWRGEPVPPGSPQRMYGFTAFAAQLNEAEDGTAPTDSRLRPDQRLFEEGRIDNAEAEKTRLEEKQRAARREGREARARWFVGVETGWEYKGGYWECRAEGRWPEDLPDIF